MSGLSPPLPKAQGAAGTVGLHRLPVGCGGNHGKEGGFLQASGWSLPPGWHMILQLRGVMGSYVTWLFSCRISKGLSEKVFAKSEEQRAAEEVAEDTGKVKFIKPLGCGVHPVGLWDCGTCDFHLDTWGIVVFPARCLSLWAGDPVLYTVCCTAWVYSLFILHISWD